MCDALIGIKRLCNNPSLGGNRRVFLGLVEDLTANITDFTAAKNAGQVNTAIPLAPGKTMVEIEPWYDSTKVTSEMKAGSGYTHGVEFEVQGYDLEIVKAKALLYDTPIFVIVEDNSGKRVLLGDKYTPLMVDASFDSGLKGSDKRKTKFSAKNDGYAFPIMPLGPLATFAVAP